MERRIYQTTERDCERAEMKRQQRETQLQEIESHRDDLKWFRQRHTTYGLMKRDVCRLANAGEVGYYEGRGQGLIDQMLSLPYTEERRTAAYNQGYHDGYTGSLTAMCQYIETNPNFDGLNR